MFNLVSHWLQVAPIFIYCRFDYCTALFIVSAISPSNGHLVRSTTSCLITVTKRYHHILPVPALLHWLSVRSQIDFKNLLLTFKTLKCPACKYISDLLPWFVPPDDWDRLILFSLCKLSDMFGMFLFICYGFSFYCFLSGLISPC